LRKEPHKRYPSAAALADDLRRFLAGETIQARPSTRWERGLKWARRHPARAAVYVLALLAVLLGGVGGALGSLWHEAETARADTAKALARLEQAKQQTEEALKREALAKEWGLLSRQLAVARNAWEGGDVRATWEYLNACRWDFRGWEHDYVYTLFTRR